MSGLLEKAKRQFNRGDLKVALATAGRAAQQDRRNPEIHLLLATIHEQAGNAEAAAKAYAAAVPLTPNLKREAGFRAAQHFLALGQHGNALSVLLSIHGAHPEDADVNHGVCSLLREAGRYDEALPFALTLSAVGRNFDNWLNAGIVLSGLGRYEEALPLLVKAQQAKPDERLAVSELFWCAANLCDFELADRMQAKIEAAYAKEGEAADIRENAFRALTWSGDEAYHAKAARLTATNLFPPPAPRPDAIAPVPADRRIRLGYVSSDFRDHPAMAYIGGVFERHDREKFETFVFCHTPEKHRHGSLRARALANIEHYVDIAGMDDDRAAQAIRAAGIDVLVDLQGFTQGNRLGIFCRRPAPRQVTYFGTPGSVAGVGIDYAITDPVITPESSTPHYEETLLRLSQVYFSYLSAAGKVERTGRRAEHGLPETGVVFSTFNQAQKIRSGVFAVWMRILHEVDGSVLWMLDQSPATKANLRRAAEAAGVGPDRLVFAPKLPMADHLRRLPHADIGLDTGPYNGHTTTADALWCGVPVVTWKGTSFASRVSESLLAAVGLPDLVAGDLTEFGRLTAELAQDEARLLRLRQHLLDARDTAPLFDAARIAGEIEAQVERLCRPPA